MQDTYGRKITYLRISVTDLCNLRCVYCMPENGVEKRCHTDMMSVDEIIRTVEASAECGITKVRITGGEPLVRKGIVDICRGISSINGIEEVCLTTNGVLLPKYAQQLRDAGVDRLNISLDTLDPEKYSMLTRIGKLDDALAGLEAAEKAGFTGTKINAVLIGGINSTEINELVALTKDKEIDFRFIELMPIGECSGWDKERFIPGQTVLDAVPELVEDGMNGVSRMYRVPGWKGRVGLIDPISHRFCDQCNRIRITADGKVKPCLHSAAEFDLRGLDREGMVNVLRSAIESKPGRHMLEERSSESIRNMNEIGG